MMYLKYFCVELLCGAEGGVSGFSYSLSMGVATKDICVTS